MTSDEKLNNIKTVLKSWFLKEGHEKCWYYPDIFNKIVSILDIDLSRFWYNVPSKEDFCRGCERYQKDLYGENNA